MSSAKKTIISKISLAGKTGTEKQKKYAEDLMESAMRTAKFYETPGMKENAYKGMRMHISKEDSDAYRGAYKMISFAVENAQTYGQVIDIMKRKSIGEWAEDVVRMAKRSGKSIDAYVKESIEAVKKRTKK